MPALNLNDLIAIGLCALGLVLLLLNSLIHRSAPYTWLRKNPAMLKAESLSDAAAEQGQRLTFGLGTDLSLSAQSLVSLPVWKYLSRRGLFNDQPDQAISGEGELACLSRMVLRGNYQDAVATELFRPDYALLGGLFPYAYLAGLLPEAASHVNAGLVLYGPHQAESLLAIDTAERKGVPVVALSDSLSAQAVFLTSSAELSLGEDFYDGGASLQANPAAAVAQRVQDILRILIAFGLIAGAVLKLMGIWA